MHRKQTTVGFFALLIIISVKAQVKHFSEEQLCDGCTVTYPNQSTEVGGDSQSEYLIRLYDVAATASRAFSVTSNISFINFDVKPLNEYEITILGRDGELYSMRISDVRRGPGEIQNLHLKSVSDTEAELHWEPPLYQTGAILQYSVSLKMNKLLGCEDLGRPTPPQDELLQNVTDTTMSFVGLHPYADYTAIVTAHTSVPGPQQTIDFRTSQSYITTSVVSNLIFDKNRNRLVWEAPMDCTTISGPILGVRLFFYGVSDAVQNCTSKQDTTYRRYFNLNGIQLAPHELYRVRIHVIRHYEHPENPNQYQELTWRTLPAAPPAVRLLEVYDLDADEKSISLRWMPPVPPNGEIEYYYVSLNTENNVYETSYFVAPDRKLQCKLWENYLCFKHLILLSNITTNWNKIEVYAKNRDVTALGAPATIVFTPKSMYNKEPSEPLNFTATLRPKGMATLKWAHPFITYTKLTRYRMRFDVLDIQCANETSQFSISVEYLVDIENKEYSADIQLQSGTTYRVFLAAINQQNFTSPEAQVEISVPESDSLVSIKPA